MAVVDAALLAAQVRREWGVGETQSVDILRILWAWEGISIVQFSIQMNAADILLIFRICPVVLRKVIP
jgi:thiamine transporter ThiT